MTLAEIDDYVQRMASLLGLLDGSYPQIARCINDSHDPTRSGTEYIVRTASSGRRSSSGRRDGEADFLPVPSVGAEGLDPVRDIGFGREMYQSQC